jgi:F0F1-type ATP synthase delta subunit
MEQAYAQALYRAIVNGTDPKKAVHALSEKLKREGRFALMHRIAKAFARVAEREGDKSRTRLFVAREHDAHAALAAAAKFTAVEKHDVHVDETLIGGWRLEISDTLVDASYKKHLLDIFNRVTA